MIIYMGYVVEGVGGGGEWTVTAGGRISLSYLELMYKMKWGSLQLQLGKMLKMFEGNQQPAPVSQ